jgi:hypothetical protein
MTGTLNDADRQGGRLSQQMVLVLAPEGGLSKDVRTLIETWTARGLVKESIWIDRAVDPASGKLIAAPGVTDVVVHEELAGRSIDRLRAVSLLVASSQEEAASLPSGAEEAAAQNTFRVLAAEAGVHFSGGVVAATVPGVLIPEHCFYEGWEFNLVVSPEDRIADDRMGVELSATTVTTVAATTLVTVAGLWRWSGDARIDSMKPARGSSEPRIQLTRTYVRITDGGFALKKIADAVLTLDGSTGTWPCPTGGSPPSVLADDPVGTVGSIANEFIDAFHLSFSPLQAPSPPPPKRLRLWEGIKLFAKTVWRIILNLPVQWVRQEQERVNDALLTFFTRHTFGEDSDIVLTLRGHSLNRGSGEPTGIERLRGITELDMPGANEAFAEPSLWSAFGTVGCGLADGSELPEGIEAPMRGASRAVVPTPDLIAPAVGDDQMFRNELLSGVELEPVDAFGAAELERCLADALHVSEQPAGAPVEPGPSPIPDAFDAGADQPILSSSSDGVAQNEASSVSSHATSTVPEALRAADLAGLSAEQLKQLQDSLATWKSQSHRSSSFAWRLGDAMGKAITGASEELAVALTLIHKGPPVNKQSEKEIALAKGFRRFLSFALIAVLVLVGLIVGLVLGSIITLIVAAVAAVIVLAASFGVIIRRFIDTTTAQAREEFRRATAIGDYWFAFNRAYAAAAGVARFCSLDWQYLDWATTLSVLIREPWGQNTKLEESEDLVDIPHPLLVTVGSAEVSADQFQRSVAASQQVVITRGWLRTAFERHVRLSNARFGDLMHVADTSATDATRDTSRPDTVADTHAGTGETIYSPRSQMRHDATGRRFGAEARLDEANQIIGEALGQPLDGLFSSVTVPPPAGRGFTGVGVTEFLSYLVPTDDRPPSSFPAGSYRVPELHVPDDIQIALPESIAAPTSKAGTSTVTAEWPRIYGERFVLGMHRVDLGEPCPASDLSFIEETSSASQSTSEVPQGIRPVDQDDAPIP